MHYLRLIVFSNRILAAFVAVALLLLIAVDDQHGMQAAVIGIAVAALVAIGMLGSSAIAVFGSSLPHPPAEERRLRGGFRRQHRPDSPGRPMPRAPGPVT